MDKPQVKENLVGPVAAGELPDLKVRRQPRAAVVEDAVGCDSMRHALSPPCADSGSAGNAADASGKKDMAKLVDLLDRASVNATRIYIMESGAEHERQLEKLGLVV